MSLMSAVSKVPDWLVTDIEQLVELIVHAANPRDAAQKALLAAQADAADAATDAALGVKP